MAVSAGSRPPADPGGPGRPTGSGDGDNIDWIAAERSPEFRELVTRQRRFIIPATLFFLGWYLAFILLAGYAPGFMGESIYQGLTVGYVLALTQFIMVWVLGWLYLRKAENEFDPLRRKAAERAIEVGVRPSDLPSDSGIQLDRQTER